MKNIHIILIVLALIFANNALGQVVNSSFNYQGQLYDNGVPANEEYDIVFDLIDSDNMPYGSPSEHNNIMVENGLFSVDVNFGIDAFDGYADVTISVKVRKSSTSPSGVYTSLGPDQTIQAVPLASNLTNGDAVSGEVLTFNGFQWNPAPVQFIWTENGSDVYYNSGQVGIGITNPAARLQINADDGEDALRVQVNSSTKLIVRNNGGTTIGSFSDQPPTDGLFVKGEVHSSVSGDADITAYIYGQIVGDGSIVPNASTSGFSSSRISTGEYHIEFNNAVSSAGFVVTANAVTTTPKSISITHQPNKFIVLIHSLSSGNLTDGIFNFIVFKK